MPVPDIDAMARDIEFLKEELSRIKQPASLLPIEEFSEGKTIKILHIGQKKLRHLVATGKLTAIKIRNGYKTQYRFTAKAIQDYQERLSTRNSIIYLETAEEIGAKFFKRKR